MMSQDSKFSKIDSSPRFFSKPLSFWDNFFPISSGLLGGWLLIIWYILNWEYLPDWLPLPGLPIMDLVGCFGPLLVCVFAVPTLLGLGFGLIGNIVLLLNRMLTGMVSKVIKLGLGLSVLGMTALPWIFADDIQNMAINHAIERYDVVINAIGAYHADHGHYPSHLDILVPDYLSEVPGEYMKFGKTLTYAPYPSGWYDHAPYTFELYGHYAGMHGQTLKYCPVEISPCYEGGRKITPVRINDRWIWVYSSAL